MSGVHVPGTPATPAGEVEESQLCMGYSQDPVAAASQDNNATLAPGTNHGDAPAGGSMLVPCTAYERTPTAEAPAAVSVEATPATVGPKDAVVGAAAPDTAGDKTYADETQLPVPAVDSQVIAEGTPQADGSIDVPADAVPDSANTQTLPGLRRDEPTQGVVQDTLLEQPVQADHPAPKAPPAEASPMKRSYDEMQAESAEAAAGAEDENKDAKRAKVDGDAAVATTLPLVADTPELPVPDTAAPAADVHATPIVEPTPQLEPTLCVTGSTAEGVEDTPVGVEDTPMPDEEAPMVPPADAAPASADTAPAETSTGGQAGAPMSQDLLLQSKSFTDDDVVAAAEGADAPAEAAPTREAVEVSTQDAMAGAAAGVVDDEAFLALFEERMASKSAAHVMLRQQMRKRMATAWEPVVGDSVYVTAPPKSKHPKAVRVGLVVDVRCEGRVPEYSVKYYIRHKPSQAPAALVPVGCRCAAHEVSLGTGAPEWVPLSRISRTAARTLTRDDEDHTYYRRYDFVANERLGKGRAAETESVRFMCGAACETATNPLG